MSPAAIALATKAAGGTAQPVQTQQQQQLQQSSQQAPAPTTGPPQIATTIGGKSPSDYQFKWYDNAQGWCLYSPDINYQISKAYLEGKPSVSLSSVNKITITIDFATLVQQGSDNTVRKVKMDYVGPGGNPLLGSNGAATSSQPGTNPWMTPPPAHAHPSASASPALPPKAEPGLWYWDADGSPTPFSDLHSAQLESAYIAQLPTTTLNINGHDYTVDFKTMQQTNNKTKFSRKISREVKGSDGSKLGTGTPTSTSGGKRPPRPSSASMGLNPGGVGALSLPPPMMTTTSPMPMDSHASDPTMACPITPGQTNNLELIPITKNSPEWTDIETKFNKTMAGKGKIESIVKVSNKNLWKKFVLERDQVMEKNNNDQSITYTRLLFHGTRNTTPDLIYNSESGFMMQFCSKGMWGIGTYFAEKSVYSNDYCHTTSNGKKQMFLAVVITGDFYDCKPDNSLKVPPERTTKKTNMAVERYDSVSGITNGSRVYIVYENNKAYPLYLITYH